MEIYLLGPGPHEDKLKALGYKFLGSQMENVICIRKGLPLYLFIWVLIHEFLHWVDWKIPIDWMGIMSFIRISHVKSKLWVRYEYISILVALRWSYNHNT